MYKHFFRKQVLHTGTRLNDRDYNLFTRAYTYNRVSISKYMVVTIVTGLEGEITTYTRLLDNEPVTM